MAKKVYTKTLDKQTVVSMHKVLMGEEIDFALQWRNQGFCFREDEGLKYGIRQHEGGPCGVLACVQAGIIQELFWPDLVETPSGGQALQSCSIDGLITHENRVQALVNTLTNTIWGSGRGKLASIVTCKTTELPTLRYAGEALEVHECPSYALLHATVSKYIGLYMRAAGPGVALLLYSMLLTRGIAMVQRDPDFGGMSPVISMNGYCTQELVNLLMVGRAYSNVFDGDKALPGSDEGGMMLRGIPKRSRTGFLSIFERFGNIEVGSNFKTPMTPVWVVAIESHYSVLFFGNDPSAPNEATSRAATALGSVSGTLDLYYYDQLLDQPAPICLTLTETQSPPEERRDIVPPLEDCIHTKWPSTHISWNQSDPLY